MSKNIKTTVPQINPNSEWAGILRDVTDIRIPNIAWTDSILPARSLVYRALEELAPSDIHVVIVGQDPYPTKGKAIGRAFAVPYHWPKINSSLENILKEIERTEGARPKDLTFQRWVDQGVLLLNTRLTVEEGRPMSHSGLGWEKVTAAVLRHLDGLENPPIVLAWGREARLMAKANSGHSVVLESSHPCKFSAHRGFKGCGHFSKVNELLIKRGGRAINWVE